MNDNEWYVAQRLLEDDEAKVIDLFDNYELAEHACKLDHCKRGSIATDEYLIRHVKEVPGKKEPFVTEYHIIFISGQAVVTNQPY